MGNSSAPTSQDDIHTYTICLPHTYLSSLLVSRLSSVGVLCVPDVDPPQRLKRPPIERQLTSATESARKAKQAAVRLVDVVFLAQRAPRAIFFLPFIRRRPSHVYK